MGVDFYACKACGETFPDCGPFERCDEDRWGCGAVFCSDDCAKLIPPAVEDDIDWEAFEALPEDERQRRSMSCVDCREELESDGNLLQLALRQLGKTRGQLLEEFRAGLAARTPPVPAECPLTCSECDGTHHRLPDRDECKHCSAKLPPEPMDDGEE